MNDLRRGGFFFSPVFPWETVISEKLALQIAYISKYMTCLLMLIVIHMQTKTNKKTFFILYNVEVPFSSRA